MEAFVCVIFALPLVMAFGIWGFQHSADRLDAWASDNGFEIIFRERRQMFRGSFSWTTARGQTVFYVKVRDKTGNTRSGYVRVGGMFLGQISDNIDVRWD